ncbi:MAG: hypothetical protein H7A33_01895 [Deltaproteobacteria bacterium]|nr:hypothetical protein [Deltaproteobacteria bacterium]
MKSSRWHFIFCMLVFLGLGACSNNIDAEKKQWEGTQKVYTELNARWPLLKASFTQRMEQATAMMEQAKSLSEEQARADAMAAANDFAGELFNQVFALGNRIDEISSFQGRLNKMALDRSWRKKRDKLMKEINQSMDQVQKEFSEFKSDKADEIIAKSKELIKELIDVRGRLKRFETAARNSRK